MTLPPNSSYGVQSKSLAEGKQALEQQAAVLAQENSALKERLAAANSGASNGVLATMKSDEVASPHRELRSISSAPGSPDSVSKSEHRLAEENRQLKAQLQSATTSWARDKQMFAQVGIRLVGTAN